MRMKVSHVFGGSFQHNILNRHMCTHMILQLGFTEKMSFWPRLLVGYITANGWLATASHIPWKKVKDMEKQGDFAMKFFYQSEKF